MAVSIVDDLIYINLKSRITFSKQHVTWLWQNAARLLAKDTPAGRFNLLQLL